MANLKTDYKDDVLDASVNSKRRWIITENGDGTVTIEDATTYLQNGDSFGAADINELTIALNECFQSVSDGKALIASAITDKKVPTDAEATFAEMAANIESLKLGSGNAKTGDVLKDKTFTNSDGIEHTGTMPNNEAVSSSLNCGGSYTIPKGFHDGNGKVTANSLESQTSATATAALITKGYTAWVNGKLITGTRAAPVKSLSGTAKCIPEAWGYGVGTVSFSSAFDTVPTITASWSYYDPYQGNYSQGTNVTFTNVTRGGFTYSVPHGADNTYEITLTWVATG